MQKLYSEFDIFLRDQIERVAGKKYLLLSIINKMRKFLKSL